MAKEGIESFLLNCQLDEKFELIEAQFGLKGFAIVIKLFQRIYGEHGYYCEWNEDISMLFARKTNVDRTLVSDIVEASLKRGIFSTDKYEQFSILTSTGIQKRYFDVVKRRQNVEVKKSYLLVKVGNFQGNVNIIDENAYINDENVNISSTREVKGSKVKGSKVKECVEEISRTDYERLVSIYTKSIVDFYIERTRKYKCCNAKKVEEWILEDKNKTKTTTSCNKFNDFNQRKYDFDDLEKKLLDRSSE